MLDKILGNVDTIIFDIDGTLYDIQDVISEVYNSQVDFVLKKTNLQRDDIIQMFEQNNIFSYKSDVSKSATEFFGKIGLDLEEWSKYKSDHFNVEGINVNNAVNPSVIVDLNKEYKLFAITSNTIANANRVLERLKINKTLFIEIISSDNFKLSGSFQKKKVILWLIEKYSLNIKSILSVGDRYDTDIRPMLELGGTGVLIYKPKGLEYLFASKKDKDKENLFKIYDFR